MLYNGETHDHIREGAAGKVTNLIQGMLEFQSSAIDALLGVICFEMMQEMKPADWTGNANKEDFREA